MEFSCSECNYTSDCKRNLKRHISRKNKCSENVNVHIIEIPIEIIYEFCNKN